MDAIDVVVKSVVRVHHWTPEVIENLYLDDTDFFGLLYWYDDVLEEYKPPEKKKV